VVLFRRRREPLHEKLAREAGVPLEWQSRYEPLRPPGIPEVGITGNQRFREWDATAVVEAPELAGDEVEFVGLADGSLLVDEEVGDASLEPLADGIEETLEPPYRAKGVRRTESAWAVGARKIEVVELRPDVEGDTIELSAVGGERTLSVDGAKAFGRIPQLEAVGEERGPDYALRATRLEGALWEVDVTPL
jgi:hypothetical protein